MIKHTPGPWVVDTLKSTGNWIYEIRTEKPLIPGGTAGKHIATLNGYLKTEDGSDMAVRHNAAIIAKAPQMYEALLSISKMEFAQPSPLIPLLEEIERLAKGETT